MYLGPPGNILTVADPDINLPVTRERKAAEHELLSGQLGIDLAGLSRRRWNLQWEVLTEDEFALINGLYLGTYGPPPFAFMDPNQRNLFKPNQSSGTDVLQNTLGFGFESLSTGGIASSTNAAYRGRRALQWTSPVGVSGETLVKTGSTLTFSSCDQYNGIPVLPSTPYTLSYRALHTSSADSPLIGARLRWYTLSGAVSATTSESSWTPGSSWSSVHSLTATSPSDAAWLRVYWTILSITTVQNHFYLDDLMLEQASSASAWVTGDGVPRVVMLNMEDEYPWVGYHKVKCDLVEVAL